jgi:hypothetical protein
VIRVVSVRVVAGLTAVAIVAGSLVAIIDGLASRFADGPIVAPWDRWYDDAFAGSSAAEAMTAGVLVVAVGAVLLGAGLWPRRHRRSLRLDVPSARTEWVTPERDATRFLSRVAGGVVGSNRPRIRIRRGVIRVRAKTRLSNVDDVNARLERCLEAERDRMMLANHPPLRISVESRR